MHFFIPWVNNFSTTICYLAWTLLCFSLHCLTFHSFVLRWSLLKAIDFQSHCARVSLSTLQNAQKILLWQRKKNLEMSITCLYKCKIIKSCKNVCFQPSIMSVHSFKFSLIKQNWHVNNRQKIRQNSLVSEILLWQKKIFKCQ